MEASVAAEWSGSEVSEMFESWPCDLFHWSKKFWPFLSWHELKLSLLANRGAVSRDVKTSICFVPQTKKWTQGIRPVYLSLKSANKRKIETLKMCSEFLNRWHAPSSKQGFDGYNWNCIVSSISLKSQKTKLAVHILKARPSNNYSSKQSIRRPFVSKSTLGHKGNQFNDQRLRCEASLTLAANHHQRPFRSQVQHQMSKSSKYN